MTGVIVLVISACLVALGCWALIKGHKQFGISLVVGIVLGALALFNPEVRDTLSLGPEQATPAPRPTATQPIPNPTATSAPAPTAVPTSPESPTPTALPVPTPTDTPPRPQPDPLLVDMEWLREDCDVYSGQSKANNVQYPLVMIFTRHDCRVSAREFDIGREFTRLVGEASVDDASPVGSAPVLEISGVLPGSSEFVRIRTYNLAYGSTTPVDVDITGVLVLRVEMTFSKYADGILHASLERASPVSLAAPAALPGSSLVDMEWLREDCDVYSGQSKANNVQYPLVMIFTRHDCRVSAREFDIGREFTRLVGEASVDDASPVGSAPVLEISGVLPGSSEFVRIRTYNLAYGSTTPVDVDITGVLVLRVEMTFSKYADGILHASLT